MVHIRRYACGIWWPTYEVGAYSYFHTDLDLRTYGPHERIVIGKFCSIADRVVISTGGMRRTDLPALYPFDVERTYQTTGDTTIGNDVWIGSGATIVGGTVVGDGAIVASEAVVLSNVPPCAVVAGNPATVIRYRFSRPVVTRLVRIAWWHWPIEKIFSNVEWFYRPIHEFLEQFDPAEENTLMEELIALIRETARISSTISVDTPLISTGLVGSLQVAAVLGAINAKYGVSLALDEIGADNFDTPRQIFNLVRSSS